MKEEEKKEIEQYLADTIMERPYGFSVGERHFSLYPITLGKMYVLQRYIEQLGLRAQDIKNISIGMLRIVMEKKDECLNIIYFHTCRTKHEVFDAQRMEETVKFFKENMTDADIASLMIMVLSGDKTEIFIKHLGIDKEQADLKKVMDVKNQSDKNSFSFGGVSIYGSFIYPLLELGMSWDEILWERSYTNLRLLLADKVNSVYVSEEERKRINVSRDRNRVDGDNREAILKAIESQSWD